MNAILSSDLDLNEIDDDQLFSLVRAAVDVIASHSMQPQDSSIMTISNKEAAKQIDSLLESGGGPGTANTLRRLLEDPYTAKKISITILNEIRGNQALADEVENTRAKNARKMSPETLLLAGAAVVLAMNVKEIKLGSLIIKFEKSGKAISEFLAGLVKNIGA